MPGSTGNSRATPVDAAQANGYVGNDAASATEQHSQRPVDAGDRQPRIIPNGAAGTTNGNTAIYPLWPWSFRRTPDVKFVAAITDDPPRVSEEFPNRRHVYCRAGQPVRAKIKRASGGFIDLYRVVHSETGKIGWQPKRPKGYVVTPYVGAIDPFSCDAGVTIFCPEGEKDVDTLGRHGLPAFTFGGSSDVPEGCAEFVRGRDVVVLADNDDPGRRWADKISSLFATTAVRVRVVHFPELPERSDVSDWFEGGGTVAALLERAASARPLELVSSANATATTPSDAPPSWANPDLSFLGSGRRPAPVFPSDLFRRFWHDWHKAAAARVSAPEDYVAVALLASAGAALANVRWPIAGAAWSEPPILWCGLVGAPSAGKSPAIDVVCRLVQHAEDLMAAGFDDLNRDYETRKHIAEAKREAWKAEVKKAAVKSGEQPPAMPTDAADPTPPTRPRIRVADATTERLGALAAALPRGLLLQRDELSGWLGSFDRYGGGGSDRAFAIEMYGGRSYVVDRMKNPEPLRVRHLSVGVLGGVQPDKLSAIIDGSDDGLASRILWVWPETTPLFSIAREIGTDLHAQNAFARLTELRMGSDQFGNPAPIQVRLSADAEKALEEFGREMDVRSREASGLFAGSLGKARGHALRLSLVIEYLWWCGSATTSEPEQISVEAVNAAAAMMDGYFIPMAERVYGDAAIPTADRVAMVLARHLRKTGASKFNARTTRREIGGVLRDASAMKAACDTLVDAGLIRPDPKQAPTGRPPLNFEVNIQAFERAP